MAPKSCCGRCLRSLRAAPAAEAGCGSPWSTAAAPMRRRTWSSGSSRRCELRPPRRTSASPPPTTSPCARARREAVLLLNPDTEVYAGTLDAALARLARAADRHGRSEAGHGQPASSTTPASAPSRPRSAPLPTSPASAAATDARHGAQPVPGDRSWATTSRARSTRSTAPSCSAAPRRCARWACSTRATGSTWRISTGATASGTPAGRSSTSRPASALHVKGGSSDGRRGAAPGDRLPPRHGPLLPPLRRPRA